MKIFTFFFISIFISTTSLIAQEETAPGKEQQYAQLLNMSPISAPARSFDNRYRGVQGSPYLWDDYRDALIINAKGDSIQGLKVRLNLVGPYVEINALKGIHGKVTYNNLQSLTITNLSGQIEYLKTGIIDNELVLLEVIYEGDLKFYRLLKKGFQKADYRGAYSAEKPFDEYVDQFAFYVKDKSDQFQKVKLKAKSLAKILPSHKDVILQYFRKKEIEKGEDLKDLFVQIDK